MDDKKEKPQKLYYSIGEVAEMFDLKDSTLRFWEKEFNIINPRKNEMKYLYDVIYPNQRLSG